MFGQQRTVVNSGLGVGQAYSGRNAERQMRTSILRIALATALALAAASATATDRAVYRDGDIEVVLLTSQLPAEFAGSESDADWQWFGARKMVTRISVTVGKAHAVLPTRAYLGMTDPGEVKITRSARKGAWTLTVMGGDASTAYRTVMEFTGQDVRRLREYALEADDVHPYVSETFAAPASLN